MMKRPKQRDIFLIVGLAGTMLAFLIVRAVVGRAAKGSATASGGNLAQASSAQANQNAKGAAAHNSATGARDTATRDTEPLGITYAEARLGRSAPSLKAPGTVSLPPSQVSNVMPRVQGQVVDVLVRIGDRVQAGQTLARMRSLDIATAQSAFRQAQDQVRFTRVALEHQQRLAQLGSFKQKPVEDARSAITQAQASLMADQSSYQQDLVVVQEDQSGVLQDESAQHQDELDEAHDKVVVDRQRRLYQDGIVARQDYEAAQNTFSKDVEKLQADREKVLADRLKVRQDQSKAAGDHLHISSDQNQVRIAQEALSRESRIFNANIYSDQAVEQAKATYFAAMQQLRQARDTLTIHGAGATGAIGLVAIPAPITGTVVARNVNPGMNVDNTNQTAWQMFTISNLTSVYVDASVSDKDLPHIHVGLPIKVQTSMGSSYTGQVNYISPTIDPQTHMIKVRCTIPNNQNQLKDGMYVTVWIQLAAPQFTLLVPSSAIQSDPAKQSSFVFVPKASGGFEQCPVRTGHDLNGQTEILSGLSQGQKVVTAGSILLKNQNSDSGDD